MAQRFPTDNAKYPNGKGFPVSENDEATTIPVIEEQIVVDKKIVEAGKVRVVKKIDEESVTVDVPVLHEEVEVERVKVNRFVERAPEIRYEGDVMVIPVVEEIAFVEKRLVVVEELRVKKRRVETNIPHTLELKKERVEIERDKEKRLKK